MQQKTNKKKPLENKAIIASINSEEVKVIARDKLSFSGPGYIDAEKEKDGDLSITFSKKSVEALYKEGRIPKKLKEALTSIFDDRNALFQATDEERENLMNQRNPEDQINKTDAMRELIFLTKLSAQEQDNQPLFEKNINHETEFGVTKAIMDRLTYLPELLDAPKLSRSSQGTNSYTITAGYPDLEEESSPTKSKIGHIGLEYHFEAPTAEAAHAIYQSYIKEMQGDALKVLFAYWKHANHCGKFNFSANLTDIMEQVSDPDRTSSFSVKERTIFWEKTRLLERTKLTISVLIKKSKIKIEHRLIDITSHSNNKKETGYPLKVAVRVLDPNEFEKSATIATAIAKRTTNLPPQDLMLALTLLTRKTQIQSKKAESKYDEEHLKKRANLTRTYQSNPRVGRKRLEEKLERIKKAEVMEDWQKKPNGYSIKYKNEKTEENDESI
jgi:hypothetical protein